MEEESKEGHPVAATPQERLRLIKEERRKQHEQRLERSALYSAGLTEESDTLKRFSKYRRSDRERAAKRAAAAEPTGQSSGSGDGEEPSRSASAELFPTPDPSREHLWNVSPVYVPGQAGEEEEENDPGQPVDMLADVSQLLRTHHVSDRLLSSFGSTATTGLTSSLSLDQSKGVLKKPAIPPILRSATEPAATTTSSSGDDDTITVKKPSILKRKDDSSSSVTPSSGSTGQSASVSFGLPVTTAVLARTKSIDSNLSGDTETGYWSGGESVGGILKSRRFPSDGDAGDQSSIMKSRRSSFGSSIVSSSSGSEGSGLQSILKRKLSYDSSYIMKEASASEYSFSTHSLPACGCLSPEPKPILKKKSNSEDLEEVEPKPILKHRSSRDHGESVSGVETEKIKPCLKKTSSKSVDENFSSVNFAAASVPSSATSPVSAAAPEAPGLTGSSNSSSNKSILKRGGILKNSWRESFSTSTSSSSSELDSNTRSSCAAAAADREPDYLSSSFLHQVSLRESPLGLSRARRFFCSEGDINTNEPSGDSSNFSSAQVAPRDPGASIFLGSSGNNSSRHDDDDDDDVPLPATAPAAADAVENGLASQLLQRPHRHHHPHHHHHHSEEPGSDRSSILREFYHSSATSAPPAPSAAAASSSSSSSPSPSSSSFTSSSSPLPPPPPPPLSDSTSSSSPVAQGADEDAGNDEEEDEEEDVGKSTRDSAQSHLSLFGGGGRDKCAAVKRGSLPPEYSTQSSRERSFPQRGNNCEEDGDGVVTEGAKVKVKSPRRTPSLIGRAQNTHPQSSSSSGSVELSPGEDQRERKCEGVFEKLHSWLGDDGVGLVGGLGGIRRRGNLRPFNGDGRSTVGTLADNFNDEEGDDDDDNDDGKGREVSGILTSTKLKSLKNGDLILTLPSSSSSAAAAAAAAATTTTTTTTTTATSSLSSAAGKSDSHDEDVGSRLSVAQKRCLFMQLESERRDEARRCRREGAVDSTYCSSGGSSSRSSTASSQLRPKRYTTQPVTTNEVEKAAKLMVQNKFRDIVGATEPCCDGGGGTKPTRGRVAEAVAAAAAATAKATVAPSSSPTWGSCTKKDKSAQSNYSSVNSGLLVTDSDVVLRRRRPEEGLLRACDDGSNSNITTTTTTATTTIPTRGLDRLRSSVSDQSSWRADQDYRDKGDDSSVQSGNHGDEDDRGRITVTSEGPDPSSTSASKSSSSSTSSTSSTTTTTTSSPVLTSKPPSGAGLSKSRNCVTAPALTPPTTPRTTTTTTKFGAGATRRIGESFMARLARIHGSNDDPDDDDDGALAADDDDDGERRETGTGNVVVVGRGAGTARFPNPPPASLVRSEIPAVGRIREGVDDGGGEQDGVEQEPRSKGVRGRRPEQEPGAQSLRDRIRMFDSMAATIQPEYKAATRKTVTSKRFSTQPVIPSLFLGRRRSGDEEYEIGALATSAHPQNIIIMSSDEQRRKRLSDNNAAGLGGSNSSSSSSSSSSNSTTSNSTTSNSSTSSTDRVKDELTAVKRKEGHMGDELLECSSPSLSGSCVATAADVHSSRQSSSRQDDSINTGSSSSGSTHQNQRSSDESETQFEPDSQQQQQQQQEVHPSRSPSPEEGMPEKVHLPNSDDSASSSSNDEEAGPEYYPDPAARDSDKYSCVKRRLSKSNSANSMMMSPESEVNLFGKGPKVNRNSIADKIAALQTNGEIGWKKRVIKMNPEPREREKPPVQTTDQNDNVELRRNNNKDSSVIANRLSQLESSQEKWRKRVGENDANIFTVQGRLERAGKITKSSTTSDVPGSPPKEERIKGVKVLTPIRFRGKLPDGMSSGSSSNSNSASEELTNSSGKGKATMTTTTTVPEPVKLGATRKQYSRSDTASSSETSEEEKVVIRSVVQNDNETFSKFFSPLATMTTTTTSAESGRPSAGGKYSGATSSTVQIDESSFKAIQSDGGRLGGIRKNLKVPRNHNNSKNPVRSLAVRLQNQTYEELSPQVREKEMKKRLQIDNLTKNAPLSVEALAGLASKEDFTAVKLKKAGNVQRAKDFPHPMLIRIKGKRQVQTRLVAPEVGSLSSGDNYILVTANKVYQFIGEYSNRLERAKIADVVSHVVQKKDLGCRIGSMTEVRTVEEPLLGGRDQTEFFDVLGGGTVPDSDDLGDESDEAYESGIVATNRVYQVDEAKGELVPVMEGGGWGCQPRFGLLQDDKVYVFDFLTEVYVWSGSKADQDLKKTAHRLAKAMFEADFVDATDGGCGGSVPKPFEGPQRPNWCFLKKINQHMEPILFIEKFFDWPDDSGRLIKVQQKRHSDTSKEANYHFCACDPEEMLSTLSDVPDPELELEGFDVGRGSEVHNKEDRRTFQITTLDVKAWNISEFSKCDVDTTSLGQFYSEETYVIRWQFSVSQIGRDLKGNISKHSGTLGRERCTYFFWQGKNSKITEQGTSALMTVELDREKGPQVRVEQGREPPAFLNLFQGLMFVHLESRESPVKDMKLYVAMGAVESEGHFIEVACEAASFRSLGSFILVDCVKGRVYLWHGKLSNSTTRNIAAKGAAKVVESPHRYINVHGAFRLIEVEEGAESSLFFNCLGVQNGKKWMTEYFPLRDRRPAEYADTKAFVFSSLQGSFEAAPVLNVRRKMGSPEAFPLLQEELYSAQQPRLFLISRGGVTWLWHGWCPVGDEENENTATGSGEIRWAAERKAALQTAVNFCQSTQTKGFVILAGLEPLDFTCIFPYWKVCEEAREANLTEERTVGITIPVEQELQKLVQHRTYTLEELQERPEGVDQSRLETYLSDEDFESLLKMEREEFSKLQSWKQNELKKAVGLF